MTIFKHNIIITLIVISLIIAGCRQIRDITQTLTNLEKLQFKLENVSNFKLAGIGLSNKSKISDFSITDGLNLASAFNKKKFPAEFILNVAAKNPNDGSGKTRSTTATITGFDWKLYIDDVETVSGDIASPIEVPSTGKTSIIPLSISLDLYEFFANKGYDGILNLALALGGVSGSTSRIKLDVKPTVSTPIGPITYPGRLTIIDKQFTN